MVERSALEAHAVVAERFEESHQRGPIVRTQIEPPNAGADISVSGKVTCPRVEIDDMLQRRLAAVVEIGPGELHTAKSRRLEKAVDDLPRGPGLRHRQ